MKFTALSAYADVDGIKIEAVIDGTAVYWWPSVDELEMFQSELAEAGDDALEAMPDKWAEDRAGFYE